MESWLDIKTSLFCCPADNYGQPRTYRQVLFEDVKRKHRWFRRENDLWVTGDATDINTIERIRANHVTGAEKIISKQTLQCYSPSALYKTKKKGSECIESKTGVIQFDFDNISQEDIAASKNAIFSLPFIGCVMDSVSGCGIFALGIIAEAGKLRQYAENCFKVFSYYGLHVDSSKGRNYSDLRFVSYDPHALIREYPEPLRIERFHNTAPEVTHPATHRRVNNGSIISWAIFQIKNAQVGQRFEAVRRVSFTLGGYGQGLEQIKETIINSHQYYKVEGKYLKHATEAFEAGSKKPIANHV